MALISGIPSNYASFRASGFRVFGFRVEGFRALGFYGCLVRVQSLGFLAAWGFRVLGMV